ncbi:MAG: iron-containing alcohol dehydrogenase, partial [Opitutales bacterium]
GNAVGMCLPAAMRFNAELPEIRAIYASLARGAGLAGTEADDASASVTVIAQVKSLLRLAGLPLTLQEHGFSQEEIPGLAVEAVEQWTAGFNPRRVFVPEVEKLYASLFVGSTCAEGEIKACL